MKNFVFIFLLIFISSSLFCQEQCDDIHKFYYDKYYMVLEKRERVVYCIHYQETIKGVDLTNSLYDFRISNDSCIVVRLSRQWNPFKPLWNTFFTSDTVSLLPIGGIKYVSNYDTIQFEGFKSAYVGPKFVTVRKKKVQIH